MPSFALTRTRPVSAPISLIRRPSKHSSTESQPKGRTDETDGHLKFLSVCVSVPHPDKRGRKGEDAAFMTDRALGVFDGVGSWARINVDAGQFSKRLASNIERVAERDERKRSGGGIAPLEGKAMLREALDITPLRGTTTATLAALNGTVVNFCNIGDGMALVIRNGQPIFSTRPQQHAFNTPYQIGFRTRADLERAAVTNVAVEQDDIVVMASDGLWDNVPLRAVLQVVATHVHMWQNGTREQHNTKKRVLQKSIFESNENVNLDKKEQHFSPDRLKAIAFDLAVMACATAYDENAHSPYSDKARRRGIYIKGGKLDDITITVSIIQKSRSTYRAMYHTKCKLDQLVRER